jgi:LuxR family maltose regulon positive regulatory protein
LCRDSIVRVPKDATRNLWAVSTDGRPPWRPRARAAASQAAARLADGADHLCGRPAGYGKTTVLAQWAKGKGRRVAWVSVDRRDNDPAVLLTYVAVALDRVEPIDPAVFRILASPGVSVLATVLPRFMAAISLMREPVALVLDHVELLENRECLDAVAEPALGLPAGSQLALASRHTPALPVALLRGRGRVVEVGVAELVGRTEGWPVGLYLAALALKASGDHNTMAGSTMAGSRSPGTIGSSPTICTRSFWPIFRRSWWPF